jgi:thiamine biosynthesis lipoprotein
VIAAAGSAQEFRFPAMGTEVVVLTLGRAPAGAVARVRELFAMREQALSRFRPTSELSLLNRRAGRATQVSPLMLETVDAAIRAARATGGAFDPTLGRQLAANGYDRSFGLPSRLTILGMPPAGPGGGWRAIAVDATRRTVTVPVGVALDFGGIAKSMAVDAALVSAGGDMRVAGPGSHDWQIGLSDTPAPRQITLSRGALATSSSSRRTWVQDGSRRHHLLDPRTGAPVDSGLRSVSVAARTCEQAEVAAKAAFVLGPARGGEFLEALGLAGLMIPTAGPPIPVGAWPGEVAP